MILISPTFTRRPLEWNCCTQDNPEYKYTIAMMGYGPEDTNAVIELTYNYGVAEYEKGNAYAQVFVDNIDFQKELE